MSSLPETRCSSLTNSLTTFASAWALIRCTVVISRSTRASVISRCRQCRYPASRVTLISGGCWRRWLGNSLAHPRTPSGQHLRGDVGEQPLGQPHRTDRLQLEHLGRDGLQADVARIAADRGEHVHACAVATLGRVALALALDVVAVLTSGLDQGGQAGHDHG